MFQSIDLPSLLWPAVILVVSLIAIRHPALGAVLSLLVPRQPSIPVGPVSDPALVEKINQYLAMAETVAKTTQNDLDDKAVSVLKALVAAGTPLLNRK